jgi:hypothetical protein
VTTSKGAALAVLAALVAAGAILFAVTRTKAVPLQCADESIFSAPVTKTIDEVAFTASEERAPGPHTVLLTSPGSPAPLVVQRQYFNGEIRCAVDVLDQRGRLARRDRFGKAKDIVRTFYDENGNEVRRQVLGSQGEVLSAHPIFLPAQPVRVGY